MRSLILLTCAVLVFGAWPARTPPNPGNVSSATNPELDKKLALIAGEGMTDPKPNQYLEELSDDIGGRVTGSAQAAAAIVWGTEKMKAIGLENVHTEPFEMSRGWTRISASAEVVSPIHHRLTLSSLGWVGSTQQGGSRGRHRDREHVPTCGRDG